VTSCSPIALPDIVPVIAQSMLPPRRLATTSAKAVCTGMAPSATTQSDCVALEMRILRPLRSARLARGLVQKVTCAG